jgi:HTH-type transcriptional regulator/antitoxin HigA
MNQNKFSSAGEMIKSSIIRNGWTQDDFANILNLSLKHVNDLINNKRHLTVEHLTNISSIFKYKEKERKTLYYLYAKEQRDRVIASKNEELENKASLYEALPIGELIKRNWIRKQDSAEKLFKEVVNTLGLESSSIGALDFEIAEFRKDKNVNFRNIEQNNRIINETNILVWYLYARSKAKSKTEKIGPYNKAKLNEILNNIGSYSTSVKTVSKLLRNLEDAGVQFLLLKHLPKTYAEGVAFWINETPIIVLSGRYDRLDNFYWNMAHEIVHILKEHGKSQPKFENSSTLSSKTEDPEEIEANEGAKKAFRGHEIIEHFRKFYNYIPEAEVQNYSDSHEIHPSIIAGMLAWEERLNYSTLHRFKESIIESIPKKYVIN